MGKGARLRRNHAHAAAAESLAHEVQVGAPKGTPADQRDPFPIYTVLDGMGLSHQDTLNSGDEILRKVREKIKFKALSDDRGLVFRYLNDADYRNGINQQMTAEALMEMGFDTAELRALRAGLQLDPEIGGTPEKQGKTARARTEDGQEHEFEFLDAPADGEVGPTTLRDKTTGTVHTVNPDLS